MSARRLVSYGTDLDKILAERDIRLFDLMLVAVRGDQGDVKAFRRDLERKIDPKAGVRIVTLEELANQGGRKR